MSGSGGNFIGNCHHGAIHHAHGVCRAAQLSVQTRTAASTLAVHTVERACNCGSNADLCLYPDRTPVDSSRHGCQDETLPQCARSRC